MDPKEIARFSKLNSAANDFVKEGSFRRLSLQIKKILEFLTREGINVSKPIGLSLSEADPVRCSFEREMLRFRAILYQHVDYFDALTQDKVCSDAAEAKPPAKIPEKDCHISDEMLFRCLNSIRTHSAISPDIIVGEGSIALERINACHERLVNLDKPSLRWWQELAWSVILLCDHKFKNNEVEFVEQTLLKLESWLADKLVQEDFECNATQALAKEHRGRASRRLGHYESSEEAYYAAIEHYLAKSKSPRVSSRPNPQLSRNYLNRRAAQVFVYGLQQLHSSRSDVKRSDASLLVGRLLIADEYADELTPPYITLCEGVNTRIRAGMDPVMLAKARDLIQGARRYFAQLQISPLVDKCDWELLIIHHLLGEVGGAEALLEKFEAQYKANGDNRRLANTYSLWSHRARKKLDFFLAKEMALKALDFANLSKNKIARFDALIACAESEFKLELKKNRRKGEARQRFEEALELASDNKKFRAVCCLGLSKVHAFQGNRDGAQARWDEYFQISNLIEHRYVTKVLATEAIDQLEANKLGFYLSPDLKVGKFDGYVAELKKWIVPKALAQHQNKKVETAVALGKYAKWLDEDHVKER